MALLITSDCINCAACEPDCPNGAISAGDDIFIVSADKCTECVGHFEESQCIAVCPVDCIIPDESRVETREQLQQKFERLTASAS
jgi:ferredoxin